MCAALSEQFRLRVVSDSVLKLSLLLVQNQIAPLILHTHSEHRLNSVTMSLHRELKDIGLDLPDEQIDVVVSFLRCEAFDCVEDLEGMWSYLGHRANINLFRVYRGRGRG